MAKRTKKPIVYTDEQKNDNLERSFKFLCKSEQEWTDELRYVLGVDPERPGSVFNSSSACFAGYCEMQAGQARKSGQKEIAQQIDDHGCRAREYAEVFS